MRENQGGDIMEEQKIMQESAIEEVEGKENIEEDGRKYQKHYILSEEELRKFAIMAAQEGTEKGIAAYKKEQEEEKVKYAEMVKNSAKTLIIHYRRLKKMKDTSVHDTDTVTDPTLAEIFERMLGQVRKEEFVLTSTNKNRIITGMIMNHVDVQLDNYRKECDKSMIPEINRRYRIVEMLYLREKPMKIDEVADVEMIDKSNVYRTLEKAYEDLAVLFFGVEGLKVTDIKQNRRKTKAANAKKSHLKHEL